MPELVGLVDVISVSLNAQDETTYNKVSKPNIEGAYEAVLAFIKQSVELGFETVASVVVGFDDNIFIDTVNQCKDCKLACVGNYALDASGLWKLEWPAIKSLMEIAIT